ncbi:MAG: 3-hydroxyacyl-CoA dehydrogenase family protein [Thermoleophilia bacterium]|nr:3-hydroxyacyl-CoA dehydrogenase family protein [Thermoleophilia bacterium]
MVGAGLMGAQIGCEYALGGHDVTLVARDVGQLERRVTDAFKLVETYGIAGTDAVDAARQSIVFGGTLDDDVLVCDLAVESLPEDMELKTRLLRAVASASPDAILASNTSSIPISTLGEAVGVPERVLGTHYLNPPLLMPTVELISGRDTDPALASRLHATLLALGKLPIVVRKDVPGFIWNRLQFALVRECVWLVENGVASAEDVDTVMREGLARRWRHVGPMRAITLGGIDTWNRAGRNIVPELSAVSALPDLAKVAVTGGSPEIDRAARDDALARELRNAHSTGKRGTQ